MLKIEVSPFLSCLRFNTALFSIITVAKQEMTTRSRALAGDVREGGRDSPPSLKSDHILVHKGSSESFCLAQPEKEKIMQMQPDLANIWMPQQGVESLEES